jgi:hypothetical protein
VDAISQFLQHLRSDALMRGEPRASVHHAVADRGRRSRGKVSKPAGRFAESILLGRGVESLRSKHTRVRIPQSKHAVASPNAVGETIEEQALLPLVLSIEAELEGGRSSIDDENGRIGHDGLLGFDSMAIYVMTPAHFRSL